MDDGGQRQAPGKSALPVLRSLWQFRRVVAAATLIAAFLGFGLSQLQGERYEATAEMLLTDPRDAGLFREVSPRQADPVRYVRNQALRMTSTAVTERTTSLLEEGVTATEVRQRVQATPSTELDLITVTASAPSGKEAAALANAVVQAYQEVVAAEIRASAEEAVAELQAAAEQLQARVAESEQALRDSPDDDVAGLQLDADVNELLATQQLIERLRIDASLYGSGVEMVEPAVVPDSPVAPRPVRNTVLAALLGFGAVAAVMVWRGDALRRVDRRHEPQELLGVPLLGAIPELGDAEGEAAYPTISDPQSPAAEAFRFAAAAIDARIGPNVRSIVVTSTGTGDGKTTVALNLAVALHQDTRSVLLVDTDIRKSGLTRLTGTERRRGLTDVVEGDNLLPKSLHAWPPGPRSAVHVCPVGRRSIDPAVFFRTVRYRALLNQLREQDYLAVVDAPPLLAVSDASAIAGSADAIVIVVNRGTLAGTLADLQERLAFVGTPVLGYVFNRASDRRPGSGYGYGYGYGYEHRQHQPVLEDAGATTKRASVNLGVVPPVPDVPPPDPPPSDAPPPRGNGIAGDGLRAGRRGPQGTWRR